MVLKIGGQHSQGERTQGGKQQGGTSESCSPSDRKGPLVLPFPFFTPSLKTVISLFDSNILTQFIN